MKIQDNLTELKSSLPEEVSLVAVSKTKPESDLMEVYEVGQRIFGENKIQEMVSKWEQLPKDIQWHMIGHVQTNKVKYIAPFVDTIHAVDRIKVLNEIQKQAEKNNRTISCLIQICIATEDTKFGFNKEELEAVVMDLKANPLPYIRIKGLMGMATFTDDKSQIKNEFNRLKFTFDALKALQTENCKLQIISMGMSGDYKLAIDCGSTMIRVGSSIFGLRNQTI